MYTLLVLLLLICHVSCTKQEAIPDEAVLTKLIVENPDSLAFILEEKVNPNRLSDEDKMSYIWWLTNVHNKQYRSLINDSLIHQVLEYHKQTESPSLFTTYQLAAEQAKSAGDIKKEEMLLSEALSLAKEKKDTATVLQISFKLAYTYDRARDLEKIKDLITITKDYSSPHWDTNTYLSLTRLYNRTNEIDSIGKYAYLGINLAQEEKKPMEEYMLTRTYVEYLNLSGQSKKALDVLRDLEHRMPIGGGIVGNEIMFNYITTLIALEEYDSAKEYIDYFDPMLHSIMSINPTEAYVIETAQDLFNTIIKTKQGGIFSTHDLGIINKLVDNSRQSIKAEKEKMLAQNKLERDKFNLEIEKGKLQRRLLWGGIAIVLIIAILTYFYQRKLLNKEHHLRIIKEQLRAKSIQMKENESVISRNEQLIGSLQSQIDESGDIKQELEAILTENEKMKERNKVLQNEINSFTSSITQKDADVHYFETLSLQNARLIERDQFLTTQLIKKTPVLSSLAANPRYIEESQWHEIIHTIDQLFDGFSVRLHIDHPTLTEEDIRYCCLFKLRLSNAIISTLMGISPSSVTKRKQRIKEKINQDLQDDLNEGKALEVYLWNYN